MVDIEGLMAFLFGLGILTCSFFALIISLATKGAKSVIRISKKGYEDKLNNDVIQYNSKNKKDSYKALTLLLALILLIIFVLIIHNIIATKTGDNCEPVQNINFEVQEIKNMEANFYFFDSEGYYYSVANKSYQYNNEIYVFLKKETQAKIIGMTISGRDLMRTFYIADNNGDKKLIYEYIALDENKIIQEFNDILKEYHVSIQELYLDTNDCLSTIKLLIDDDKIPQNENDFSNSLVEMYTDIKPLLNKYNYTSQITFFEFVNKNPFAKTAAYETGGYIRTGTYLDSDKNWYFIYLNAVPIKIN